MRLLYTSLIALAIAIIGFAGSSGTASADETLVFPVAVTCTSTGQLCTPDFDVEVFTGSRLDIEFIASSGHCSDIRVFVRVEGVLVHTSGFLDPGESTGEIDVGPVIDGFYTISIQAEGTVGGCNTGNLGGWAGTLQITTSEFSPTFVRPRTNLSGFAAAITAAASQQARENRARVAAAAAPPVAAPPVVTPPRTGTGLPSALPSTGSGGYLPGAQAGAPAVLLALASLMPAAALAGRALSRRLSR